MRKIVIFTSLVIVLGVFWVIYLNQEDKKFVESLPQIPNTGDGDVILPNLDTSRQRDR